MRLVLRLALASSVVLMSAASFAQSDAPMVGDKPLVQVKPRGMAKHAAVKQAAAKPQSTAVRLQGCLDIDDGTKERLNCYDEVYKPAPKDKAPAAKSVPIAATPRKRTSGSPASTALSKACPSCQK